ncbi:unnamed protein product, partial [Scytosiphon promiscuus]
RGWLLDISCIGETRGYFSAMGKKSKRRGHTSRKDAEDFVEAVHKAASGEEVSRDAQELDQHVNDVFGPPTQVPVAVEPGEALDGGAEAASEHL